MPHPYGLLALAALGVAACQSRAPTQVDPDPVWVPPSVPAMKLSEGTWAKQCNDVPTGFSNYCASSERVGIYIEQDAINLQVVNHTFGENGMGFRIPCRDLQQVERVRGELLALHLLDGRTIFLYVSPHGNSISNIDAAKKVLVEVRQACTLPSQVTSGLIWSVTRYRFISLLPTSAWRCLSVVVA